MREALAGRPRATLVRVNAVPTSSISRRRFLVGLPAAAAFATLVVRADGRAEAFAPHNLAPNDLAPNQGRWRMPAEETRHERTWMCWPSGRDIWGRALPEVQASIASIALAIAANEPVTLLARPHQVRAARAEVGADVEVVGAPVDDLWARDTLPCFLLSTASATAPATLGAGRVRFNGWGHKQRHGGDRRLAGIVAEMLGVEVVDSGVVGEGGGLEIDGAGTVLASESSWVNENRNPDRSRADIEAALLDLLGADRFLWVDGLAGKDITDDHIDSQARFASPTTIVLDRSAAGAPEDVWSKTAARTRARLTAAATRSGEPYKIVDLVQPESVRNDDADFLATYLNYYVCNGAVIAPSFGDRAADERAHATLSGLFPGRRVTQLDIDPVAAGGGGIHCATQQQPALGA